MKAIFISFFVLSTIGMKQPTPEPTSMRGPVLKVCSLKNSEKVLISSAELAVFVESYTMIQDADVQVFRDMQIAALPGGKYYLLTTEETSRLTFAFDLLKVGKSLFVSSTRLLHTCGNGSSDLATFQLKEGRIIGCQAGNHSISQGRLSRQ